MTMETQNHIDNSAKSKQETKTSPELPSVFDFADYRDFLKASFDYKKAMNPSFSETAFIMKAGLGANSRGYLGLILRRKRNLSAKTILGFSKALKLSSKESLFFENLVLYNQAKNEKDKNFYFERMKKHIKGRRSEAFELLESQYNYFSNWYLVAIRELVPLSTFSEDLNWISAQLRGRVSKKDIKRSIEDLLKLGLLSRDSEGKLIQSSEHVRFICDDMKFSVVSNLHKQILENAAMAIDEDPYEERSTSAIVLAADASKIDEMKEEVKDFRKYLSLKYGSKDQEADSVFTFGFQIFQVTPINKNKNTAKAGGKQEPIQ